MIYFSILQYNLVFLLPRVTFADAFFSVGAITRDKVKWFRSNVTAFSVSQEHLILSATLYCTLIHHYPPLAASSHVAAWLLVSYRNKVKVLRAEHSRPSVRLSYNIDD